eukprot:CAMPEP_0185277204 /NCGR_PEP_ID=MMETSP1359-20130426/58073_1 /TAXON_ID=552665 /ORGANISM="Bigelowiella longifila, Strain CCMP242" /LENGTH=185 /DNA_ID=CAMNT_0027871233 /DNA_START=80 /DNA_END=637 /DNA_ORIENTATION=-
MKELKNEINNRLNGTDVSGCVQLIDMPFPKMGDSGYSELCETFCANVSDLSSTRKAALDSAHYYHPAAFLILKFYEKVAGIVPEPTPTCFEHFGTVDQSDHKADVASAACTLALILAALNFAASDESKGLKMLSMFGNGAVAACLAFFYISGGGDLVEATYSMSWCMVPPLMLGYLGFASKILDF